MRAQNRQFVSFDGGVTAQSKETRPDRYRFFSAENFPQATIARGAGLSYAAASFETNSITVDHKSFSRILSFDEQTQTIEVEAGMSLGQLYDFLTPSKLFLATQPGHPSITIGGCVAADIHGKNQFRDGTFIDQVLALSLFHPAHGILRLSKDSNEELFRLTCGGYGLTGNILSVKLQLKDIPSPFAQVSTVSIDNIEQLPAKLKESAARADFVFSWHDFNSSGDAFGKGFIQEGKFIDSQEKINKRVPPQSLSADSRGALPLCLFNMASMKALNTAYGLRKNKTFNMSLFDCIFPIQNSKELYFKFFGAAGFHECQLLMPEESFTEYVTAIKKWLQQNKLPITLASAKLFSGEQDLLRFSGSGICFALNFPRCADSLKFLTFLDDLTSTCKAIPNIIKDSRLPKSVVESSYPHCEDFRTRLKEFDPDRVFKSEISQRLAL